MKLVSFFGSFQTEHAFLKDIFRGEISVDDRTLVKYGRVPYFVPLFINKGSKDSIEFLRNFWLEKIPTGIYKRICELFTGFARTNPNFFLLTTFSITISSRLYPPDVIIISNTKTKKFYIARNEIENLGFGIHGSCDIIEEARNREKFAKFVKTPQVLRVDVSSNSFIETFIHGSTLSVRDAKTSIREAVGVLNQLLRMYRVFGRYDVRTRTFITIVHGDFSLNNIIKEQNKYWLIDFESVHEENVWWDIVWLFFRTLHYTKRYELFALLLEAYERENFLSPIVHQLSELSQCSGKKDIFRNIEYCVLKIIKSAQHSPASRHMTQLIHRVNGS